MIIDSYRRQVTTHRKNIAKLQADKGHIAVKAATCLKKKQDALSYASRCASSSTMNMKLREADRHETDYGKAQIQIATLERKIADEHKKLVAAQAKVDQEAVRDQKKEDTAQKKRDVEAKKLQTAQQRAARSQDTRILAMDAGLARHDVLHSEIAKEIKALRTLPDKITVLFFASDPTDKSSSKLALDEEARSIQQHITASRHRDSINFQTRWAVRHTDILQAINELEPTVVHFSGHGTSADALVLQDDKGRPKHVSKRGIVNAIASGSDAVRLVFFNTCFSFNQAEGCIQNVDAAIGMKEEIGDDGARVFASQFYSSIGFGHSITKAFAQAQAALTMEDPDQADIPSLYCKPGLTDQDLTLVRPNLPNTTS